MTRAKRSKNNADDHALKLWPALWFVLIPGMFLGQLKSLLQ